MDVIRVGDVDGVKGGREGDAVRATEAIGNDADIAGSGIEAVHLAG